MRTSTSVLQTHITDDNERTEPYCRGIIQQYAASMSMAFSMIIYLLLRNHVGNILFLRFVTALTSFSYLGLQYFCLFNSNKKSFDGSQSIFGSVFYLILNIIFLMFSIISFISIISFPVGVWGKKTIAGYFTTLFPLLALSTFLLSTSCSVTSSSFEFTTTDDIDMFLDFSALLCVLMMIVMLILCQKNGGRFFFAIVSTIPVLIRSYRRKHLSSPKYQGPTTIWRPAIPTIILAITLISYSAVAYVSLNTLYNCLEPFTQTS
ncbi:DUF2463 domain-containing protein [Encephalitozoon hellem]|uniref:DUF2463 domain-containing protein n=1 Tax=Encephalitozoon hellem TaxID=27973 RepID=A0A9Q9C352_ENCHE|nr:DUF2463 domain-containing protein [Encephalitozoon hellem]WEL38719.1 DUF2463 domain-containing protein [Encephalitozoon hellem]